MELLKPPKLILPKIVTKAEALEQVNRYIKLLGLEITSADNNRPWGGFYVISPDTHSKFLDIFFPLLKDELAKSELPISAKVLVIEPKGMTSDQYHRRRKEVWRVWSGPVEVYLNHADPRYITNMQLADNQRMSIELEERHRIIGHSGYWGVLAETWIHTNPDHLSDEEDIVRVEDDYGRT